MATRERPTDRGARVASRLRIDIGDELRRARLAAGLSQSDVGRAVGISYSEVGRIERGRIPGVSVELLARSAAVLGLDLSVRVFPGGRGIRDAGQVGLLERLRARLHPRLTWQTEVPLPIPGDLRAWDAVVGGAGPPIAVEAEMRLIDAQALARRIALKQRDAAIERVIVLAPATRFNAGALPQLRAALGDGFRLGSREILRSLGEGRDPGGSGIVVL